MFPKFFVLDCDEHSSDSKVASRPQSLRSKKFSMVPASIHQKHVTTKVPSFDYAPSPNRFESSIACTGLACRFSGVSMLKDYIGTLAMSTGQTGTSMYE